MRCLSPFPFIAAIAAVLLLLMNFMAPLQLPTVAVYTGFVIALLAAFLVVRPVGRLGIGTRPRALVLLLSGVAIAVAGFFWPAPLVQASGPHTRLDDFMPAYEFSEHHELRVHAPPQVVAAAAREVTFGDIAAFQTLMRIRAAASGNFKSRSSGLSVPVMKAFTSAGSPFFELTSDGSELVMGGVGKFWNSAPRPKVRDSVGFEAFNDPGYGKMAFNLRVEDDGGGWTRLSTETRLRSTDDSGRRALACYWRVIYPGSGLLRRTWLDAARRRAEGT